ncbi:ABC transporter ATP-binding protein [Paenibacillus alvei]|uniref:ABC transporter ATP-binding protein n=1 Tax=Paenibacillus alvei TaxID=44250 RepID=UPI00227E8D0E|nr:ATP-binding cassette domain-containing protein [Paenibacillus alvei]
MSIVSVNNLYRHYKVLNRRAGFIGNISNLFSRDYRTVKAVDGISMEFQEGEIVAFVGPNGAGKSTTIKMMTGVLEPTSGNILVNGIIPYKNRVKNAENIGVVFGQRCQLWWDLPVIESFKLLKLIYKIDKNDYEANMSMFDEVLNLKSLYTTPVRFLSLGQRMLCDIAAAFLHNPKVIFLDEPTIGLDISVKSKIREFILRLNVEKKTTVFLTTHDIGDIEALCERIILIDKGMIIYDGSIQKIINLYGAYRTLKIEFLGEDETIGIRVIAELEKGLENFNRIAVDQQESGWLQLTFNQENIELVDIMNVILKKFKVKDIKLEEVKTESIIKKVYERELLHA